MLKLQWLWQWKMCLQSLLQNLSTSSKSQMHAAVFYTVMALKTNNGFILNYCYFCAHFTVLLTVLVTSHCHHSTASGVFSVSPSVTTGQCFFLFISSLFNRNLYIHNLWWQTDSCLISASWKLSIYLYFSDAESGCSPASLHSGPKRPDTPVRLSNWPHGLHPSIIVDRKDSFSFLCIFLIFLKKNLNIYLLFFFFLLHLKKRVIPTFI